MVQSQLRKRDNIFLASARMRVRYPFEREPSFSMFFIYLFFHCVESPQWTNVCREATSLKVY